VTLPDDVMSFLSTMSVSVSFGLDGLMTTPLECIGASGFVPRLLFWMALPPCAVAMVILLFALTARSQGADRTFTMVAERAAPWVLRILFLLYPVITNLAVCCCESTSLIHSPGRSQLTFNCSCA
jgi:uncharacterized membrane protein